MDAVLKDIARNTSAQIEVSNEHGLEKNILERIYAVLEWFISCRGTICPGFPRQYVKHARSTKESRWYVTYRQDSASTGLNDPPLLKQRVNELHII
jgi:hypothetical protein